MQNRKINKQSTSLGKFGNFFAFNQIKEDKCRVVTKFHRRGRFEFVELVSDPFVYIYIILTNMFKPVVTCKKA